MIECKLETCNNLIKKNRLYCCVACSKEGQVRSRALVMDQIKEKRRKTNLERYGVENTGQSKELREKYKETNLEKYGVENPLSDPAIRQKVKQTTLETYGVIHATQSVVVKDKIKSTNLDRYGVSFASKLESVKTKAKHTNLERYGVEYHTKLHISESSTQLMSNITWLTDQHHTALKPIFVIADELGISKSQLGKIYSENNIDILHFKKSRGEMEIVSFIQSESDTSVLCNLRNIIGSKELDIYIPDNNFAIEYNGAYWHSERSGNKDKNYHLTKTIDCKAAGINLLHIFDYEWKTKPEIIKSMIRSRLGILSDKVYARNCEIRVPSKEDEYKFLNNSHIQGYVRSEVCYGLYSGGILVSLMSFGKSRYNKHVAWELLRFSNTLNTNVTGGASKLLAHCIKNNSMKSIISYSHRDKFTGNLYKQLGFIYSHSSAPAYHYTKDYVNFENRLKFQKHKLNKLLVEFDQRLTEWENMKNNNYDRIWDCGNDVWILNILSADKYLNV